MGHAFAIALPDEIRANRLTLRGALETDAQAFAEAARESAETVGRWMSFAHATYTPDEALSWFAICRDGRAMGNGFEYLVFDDTNRLLGGVGLGHVNRIHRFANLGYWIRASAEKHGYASEAAHTLANAGLAAGLQRVEIVTDVENLASQRVAEKIGGTREARLHSRIFMRGEPRDAFMYSIVRT